MDINISLKEIPKWADAFAIPLWALAIFYFYQIEEKTPIEMILFLWTILGFSLDVLFTLMNFYLFFI